MWDGYGWNGVLTPLAADLLRRPLIDSSKAMAMENEERHDRFMRLFAGLVAHYSEKPAENEIPRVIGANRPSLAKHFHRWVGGSLDGAEAAAKAEWWERWIRPYWLNRISSVPYALTSEETFQLANWVGGLKELLPEAMKVATSMPKHPWPGTGPLDDLSKDEKLLLTHPGPIADLVLWMEECGTTIRVMSGASAMVTRLIKADLPEQKVRRLMNLQARLGADA